MLKFAANLSMLFTERPLIERFAAARAAGFDAVEIQFPYELSISDIQTELRAQSLQLALINVAAGDLMQGGDGLAGIPGREQAFADAVQQTLDYARALQVPRVNVLAGRKPSGESRDACMSTLLNNLDEACHHFHKAGIQTLVEAINIFDMPGFLVHSLNDMQQLCEHNDRIRMQFDCYHMARMGEDVLRALRNNLPLIGHIQFADNPGRHEPGTGRIDYGPVFSFLQNSDYTGWCAAEYRPSHRTEDSLGWLEDFRSNRPINEA